MSSVETVNQERALSLGHVPAWLWLGVGVYVLLLINGGGLLNDSDTYLHIAVGQWILDHPAMPRVDIYSFTKAGEPWISTSWFAQILFAEAYELIGWTGPIVLAAASVATTFALLAFILSRRIPSTYAILIALAALVLSIHHLFARPHVLVMPVMVAWVSGLVSASERREAPSFRLLPLMVSGANLSAVLRNALRMGIDPCVAQDSRTRRVAAPDLRMDAGGLQPFRPVRGVCARLDRGRAVLRRQAFAAPHNPGAGLVAYGVFARPESRDLCLADAACRAYAAVNAIRSASGPICQHGHSDRFSRNAGRSAWRLNMGLCGQLQVFAHGGAVTGLCRGRAETTEPQAYSQ